MTAFDALYGSSGTPGNDMNNVYPGSYAITGSDLSNDHPINVSISADSAGIKDESTITSAGLKVFSGQVECASCHDAHGTDGHSSFLRVDNANSALCLGCHNK